MPLLTGVWGSQASLSESEETAELIVQLRFYCQCLPMCCAVCAMAVAMAVWPHLSLPISAAINQLMAVHNLPAGHRDDAA